MGRAEGRCEDQGAPREVSDRNDSQGCSGEENPSGNRTGMKQEFAALFKAYRRRGYSGERRLKERRMKLLYNRDLRNHKGFLRWLKQRKKGGLHNNGSCEINGGQDSWFVL